MEIHSDRGKNFESNLFQRVTEVLGLRNTLTMSLHPPSDGMVKRFNRTMEEHLEGDGRTSEKLESTPSTVPTGLSISCP